MATKKEKERGSIEKVGPERYRLRVTVGYLPSGNPDRIQKVVRAASDRKAYRELDDWIEELEEQGYTDIYKITLQTFYDKHWLSDSVSLLEPRTRSDYIDYLELRFLPILGRKKLQEITPAMIRKIVTTAKRLDNKPGDLNRKTKKKMLNALSNVFNLALDDYRIVKENPVLRVKLKKEKGEKKKRRVDPPYTLDEIDRLFQILNDVETPLRSRALIYSTFFTGARAGELAALEEDDFDFDNNTIIFHQRITSEKIDGKNVYKRSDGLKTESDEDSKTMAVPSEYLDIMKQFIAINQNARKSLGIDPSHKYVFGTPEGAFCKPPSLSQHWERFVLRHDLRKIRFHDLRHTNASYLVALDISTKTVQERLGHSDYKTTVDMYVSSLKEIDVRASDVLGALLTIKTANQDG